MTSIFNEIRDKKDKTRMILYLVIIPKGSVKFFNEAKGFGFIVPEDESKDLFVHVSGLEEDIQEGDTVEYEVEEGKKGLNAVNLKLA
jgi:CspA family cold shock protein